jgi:hypothetical protein
MKIAATVAVGLLIIIALFQVVLAMGAPLGNIAWGGKHDRVLPGRLRAASAVAGLVVYPAVIVVVLSASSLIETDLVPGRGMLTMWALATLFVVGAIANAASRSPAERWWAPISLAIAICCAAVAAGL